MKYAKRAFLVAGIYGLLALLPQYFLEQRVGREYPPAITHPEFYYGFLGVAIAWQVVFLIISRDPVRYRIMMLPSIFEKAGFGIAVIVLSLQQRVNLALVPFAVVDLILGAMFLAAFRRTHAQDKRLTGN